MKNETTPTRGTIPPALSVYLDLIRFIAAVIVVLYHTWPVFYPQSGITWAGHEAVVVFFVLSGYVIAHATSRPGIDLLDYAINRVARIVPVAWAALLLALMIALVRGEFPVGATLVNMVFMGQSGFWSVMAPDNSAYWSLNYEVWYYAIFAVWMFSPRKYRVPFTAVALLLAGPKVLLLLPVWLMGVWLYRKMPDLTVGVAGIVFLASVAIGFALFWFNVSDVLRQWLYDVFPPAWRLHYSTQFLYDLLLGPIVCAHFAAVAALGKAGNVLARFEAPIRYLASFTFSIYVFHSPLYALHRPGISTAQFYCELAFCIFVLAQLTERRVNFFRQLFRRKRRIPYVPA